MPHSPTGDPNTIETRASWVVAVASFVILSIGWGAPYAVVVALKPIAADFGAARSVPSFASALGYVGTGVGGIAMGWFADRIGAMWPALVGSIMVGCGAMLASAGAEWQLYLGYGLMIGLLGNAGIFAPLMANVSRWFDLRRGTALALVASGQQIAGAFWPPVFRYAADTIGWRGMLFWYGLAAMLTMAPLCLLLRRRPPEPPAAKAASEPQRGAPVLGLAPNLVLGLICAAIVCCCVPMAMPLGHIVALCSDLGYAPARGAEMLSLLLGTAFLSRMFWGRLSDRIGGLRTVLIGSACQVLGLALYLVIDDLVGLYAVSAAFGFGFVGIIPSYVLSVRELFPPAEAGWRIGTVLLFGLVGMALGGWLGGFIYDRMLSYGPSFAVGIVFNLANLALIGGLVRRRPGLRADLPAAPGRRREGASTSRG